MTSSLFDANLLRLLRGSSLFHGGLPFLLVCVVLRPGCDQRSLVAWTALVVAPCVAAVFVIDNRDECET